MCGLVQWIWAFLNDLSCDLSQRLVALGRDSPNYVGWGVTDWVDLLAALFRYYFSGSWKWHTLKYPITVPPLPMTFPTPYTNRSIISERTRGILLRRLPIRCFSQDIFLFSHGLYPFAAAKLNGHETGTVDTGNGIPEVTRYSLTLRLHRAVKKPQEILLPWNSILLETIKYQPVIWINCSWH